MGGKSILSLTDPIIMNYLKYAGQENNIVYKPNYDDETYKNNVNYKNTTVIVYNDIFQEYCYKSNEKDNNNQTIYNYYIEKNALYVVLKLELNIFNYISSDGYYHSYYLRIKDDYFYLMKDAVLH